MKSLSQMRISYLTLYGLLGAMAPHGSIEEEMTQQWDMNKASDIDALCEAFLKVKLKDFNSLGFELCRNTLLYRVHFDLQGLIQLMDNLDVLFGWPSDMRSFYTYVWEHLFNEKFPEIVATGDFYVDEINMHDLHRLVFDKR